ncbi:MAG: ATPase, T2SS/T4P/T4SS family [Planctomycetota bacterium]
MLSSEVLKQLRVRPVGGLARPVAIEGEPITIGRHPDNVMQLLDAKSSRHHATLAAAEPGETAMFSDLGSRNGSLINGEPVTGKVLLREGDVITIGDTDLIIESVELSVPEAEARTRDALSWKGRGRAAQRKEQTTNTVAAKSGAPARPAKSKSNAKSSSAAGVKQGPSWAREMLRVLKELPPEDSVEAVPELIDARGNPIPGMDRGSEGPVAFLLMLQIASKSHATDIHVEPKTDKTNVRMRVDGQMAWICEMPRSTGDLLGGIVKAACSMKSTHKDAVLDGHFSARFPDRRVEFRASLTPSVYGQKLVLRVLDQRDVPTSLAGLGLLPYMVDPVRRVTRQDAGMFLVCGPTGSGKTTTLYNALREIDRDTKNVVTIEDPVEYQLDGVTQMPIDEARGNGFDTLLRSVLRQDPDVILVGEIRDEPTARTALQAAMTGHVVFSTVHAKETFGAVFRLLDLGVEPYLVANSLDLVLAQRLVRVLCPACKAPQVIPPGVLSRIGPALRRATKSYTPVGCSACLGTGFRGRQALFELLAFDDKLRDAVLTNPSVTSMKNAISGGLFTTLAESGWRLVSEGVTSIDEVERVAG